MRILFDHGTPSGIARTGARWSRGDGSDRARVGQDFQRRASDEGGGRGVLTTDKKIRYQQNLKGRKIAIVVLGNSAGRIVRKHLDRIAAAVNEATPGSYVEIEIPFR